MSKATVGKDSIEVGWICALHTEFVAACQLLDEEYAVEKLNSNSDENIYTFGRIGHHQVVISCLPKGRYGLTSAALVASDMMRDFPSIRFGLMVGIGGGAPSKKHDIRLGDVVVGCPSGTSGGVINIQYGKNVQGTGFVQTGSLTPPPRVLLSALNKLIAQHERSGHLIQKTIDRILENPRLTAKYQCPGRQNDHLYKSRYLHRQDGQDCDDCCSRNKTTLANRKLRPPGTDDPVCHYGIIASADSLMKDAIIRDELAQKLDVLCFEMEAAGLMDHFPCLIIRGICDYSDTHKNKKWQGYAAAVAAAYAKELLDIVPSKRNSLRLPPVTSSRTYYGLFALNSTNSTCLLDVVAIHGLGGDAVATWKTPDGYPWLRNWLSKRSDASLLTYGYDSSVTWSGGKTPIYNTALRLLEVLRDRRPGRNFVFICHGLGGIILRVALALSWSLTEHSYLREKMLGLIFLGTPQGHLLLHEWMSIIYRMSNSLLTGKPYRMAFMENVEALSATLNLLSFEHQPDLDPFAVLSYYETIPVADTGSVIVGPDAVITASAREVVLPINADHTAMAAPDRAALEDQHETYASITELVVDLTSNEKLFVQNTELLRKLYCVDYELYSVNVPDASLRTGTWLYEQQSFKTWASASKSRLFWVKAPPGYGKTVIAKGLTRDLKNRTERHPHLLDLYGSTVLAFFFREEADESRTAGAFLRSLLHQLVLQHPALGPHIQQAFDNHDTSNGSDRNLEPHLSVSALWSALQSVLHNKILRKVTLLVDGLDEADPKDIREVAEGLLRTLRSATDETNLKMFLASRDIYFKQLSLERLVDVFHVTAEHTSEDIHTYLRNVIEEFSEEHNIPQEAGNRVKKEISEKAEGMFLWASLAWDHFKGGVAVWSQGTIQERLTQLESLPPGLGELYNKLLQRIDEKVLQGLHTLFAVVAATARPISCEEAEQLLGIKGWEVYTSDLDIPFSVRSTIEIYCAGLLKISSTGVIRVVHLSLKDFLREAVLQQDASALHSKIARDCIHYLTLADVREQAQLDVQRSRTDHCLMRRFILYNYAATYLQHHMRNVEPEDHVWLQYASMTKHHAGFHVAASSAHISHVNTRGLVSPAYYTQTPLRQAIRQHGSTLIPSFARAGYDLDETVDYDSAIHSHIGKPNIVSMLLACGASPNIQDYSGRSPLHESIRLGCQQTTKLLLETKDIDVNVQDSEGKSALHYEATSGRGSLLLNDPRVDVDLRDKSGRTPVTTAAFWGDRETTIAFLRSARNSMAQHEGELSILVAAAQQGWLEITLEILSRLPDVSNHRSADGRTILHLAVFNDWQEVLLLAITKGHAKVNAIDKRMRTPLHEAAELGNFKLARKLMTYGASSRCRDRQGRTPIQLAVIEGFSDTVSALMSYDFAVNDADHQQRTIVHWAASWDWPSIMQRVIEQSEVDLLKHDHMGRTALHIAALCGCPQVLDLLINQNIFNVNETDSFNNSLLHLGARGGSTSVIDVILKTHDFSRMHSVNNYGQTALDVAIAYGTEKAAARLSQVPLRAQRELNKSEKVYYMNAIKPEPNYHTDWVIVHQSELPLPREPARSPGSSSSLESEYNPPSYAYEYARQPEAATPPNFTPPTEHPYLNDYFPPRSDPQPTYYRRPRYTTDAAYDDGPSQPLGKEHRDDD